MQLEAMAVTSEGVRENDVASGIDKLLMHHFDAFGVIGDPELRRLARGESQRKIVRARRAIG
jgi:hypothetical protein